MKNWNDVYKLPLKQDEIGSRVYDAKGNFVFQFTVNDKDKMALLLEVINGNHTFVSNDFTFKHDSGNIIRYPNPQAVILIRGWGNLTGTGGHRLTPAEAANVQDTFAEYIVERLNHRN